jgi:hypothetical protein
LDKSAKLIHKELPPHSDNMTAIKVLMPHSSFNRLLSTTMYFHQSRIYSVFPFIISGPWCAQDKQNFWSPTTDDVHNSDGAESMTSNCTTESELRSSLASSFGLESQELPSTPEASSSSADLSTCLLHAGYEELWTIWELLRLVVIFSPIILIPRRTDGSDVMTRYTKNSIECAFTFDLLKAIVFNSLKKTFHSKLV